MVPGVVADWHSCGTAVPPGAVVRPQCQRPKYYSAKTLAFMHCIDGQWDYVARCNPECGIVTPDGTDLIIGGGGWRAKRGELPWHAGVYKTTARPYKQVCGGSLVSNKVILSAAHCFWNDLEKQLPAAQFAVAVGKIFRPWDDAMDMGQKSQVGGWGLTSANGKASPVLQVLDLPYVDVASCIRNSRPDYRGFITSDKICAGTLESTTALCEGDSGGGLAFPEETRGVQRYFLRGVVSTAPTSLEGHLCNFDTYTSFTSTLRHEHFIKQFLDL